MLATLSRTLATRAERSTYQQVYPVIIKLHMLTDLKLFVHHSNWFTAADIPGQEKQFSGTLDVLHV